MRYAFATLLFVACSGVPAEVTTGVAIQSEAWKNVAANVRTIVMAYDKELRASYDKQLDDYFAAKMRASLPESVPSDIAIETYEKVQARRLVIYADLDKKRDEFLADDNIQIGKMAGDLLADYIRTTDEAYAKVRELIATVKGTVKP